MMESPWTTGAVPPREGGPGPKTRAADRGRALTRLIGGSDGARAFGAALGLDPGTDLFTIEIVDEAGDPLLALGPFAEEDVVALWRDLGTRTGLPLLVRGGDGTLESPYPQIGRLQLGPVRIRRRHGLLNGRRPRFLVRRKTGRWPLRPRVHRNSELFRGAQ
jgi:hypothetical protein